MRSQEGGFLGMKQQLERFIIRHPFGILLSALQTATYAAQLEQVYPFIRPHPVIFKGLPLHGTQVSDDFYLVPGFLAQFAHGGLFGRFTRLNMTLRDTVTAGLRAPLDQQYIAIIIKQQATGGLDLSH